MLHIRPKILCRPLLWIGIRDDARDLANDIGKLGNLRDVCAPGIENSFFHLRDATVVENETYPEAARNQIDGNGKLSGEHTDVEGQAIVGERSYIFNERLSPTQFVRLRVQHTADSFQFGMACDLVQIRLEIPILRPATSDDSLKRIVSLISECEQMTRLVQHVALIDVCLQMNRLHDVQALCSFEVVWHAERAVQRSK